MESILIVDDEPLIRNLLNTILKAAGYRCLTAESVAQAKQALAHTSFELLVTDLDMPKENGIQLIRHCKQHFPEMAVVIASVLDDPQQVKEILELGVYGYLIKPFTNNLVLITVDNALRRHRLELQERQATQLLEHEVLARTRTLDEQVHFLQTLIDAIPLPIYYKNTGQRYLGCNQAFARALNRQRDEIIGRTAFAIHPPAIAEQLRQRDEELLRTGGTEVYERTLRLPDGSERIGITHKATFADSSGTLAGLVGVILDITELKNTDQSLRISEEKLRSIMDNLQIGVMMISPEMTILQVNKQMRTWFPGLADNAEGLGLLDFIAAQGQPQVLADFSSPDLFGRGTPQELTGQLQSCLGQRIFRMVFSPVQQEETSRISAAVGLFEDITDKLVMERDLNQAQKLEAIGQLAAGIAHEINTPVQYIGDNLRFLAEGSRDMAHIYTMFTHLMETLRQGEPFEHLLAPLEQAIEGADLPFLLEEIPKTIEQSMDGINRVGAIVRAMREFSHPGSEEKVLVDINHALENTLTVSRNEWKYLAESVTELAPDLPMLHCLPGEINQAFLNIIVNAAHAISEATDGGRKGKGIIRVSTRVVGDGWMEIRIADTGRGIPEPVQRRIFDPFFTTKKIGKGTGQGLAIARSVVVDKHQGRLRFETELGKGTTFIIQLPLT